MAKGCADACRRGTRLGRRPLQRNGGAAQKKGGNPNGDSSGSDGIERQDWTDKTTDQRKMGGQRFGKNFPDDQSFNGRSDYASGGGRRAGCRQGGSGSAGGVRQGAVAEDERGATREPDEQAGGFDREARG